jgi:hypothetical protein
MVLLLFVGFVGITIGYSLVSVYTTPELGYILTIGGTSKAYSYSGTRINLYTTSSRYSYRILAILGLLVILK